jgi:phytoene dehydrogenase-like protein
VIHTDCGVERVLTAGARATALLLADGSTVPARAIAANVAPKLLYLRLLDGADLPPEFRARMQRYRSGSGSFRTNVALTELPRFSARPEVGVHHGAGIILAPSLAYMERAYMDAPARLVARPHRRDADSEHAR